MNFQHLRVVCTLVGNIQHQPDMQVKYGRLLDSLSRQFNLVDVLDASLHGFDRYWNALQVFYPQKKLWKERYFKNVAAFETRSVRIADHLMTMRNRVDIVLQIGATFDSTRGESRIPVVVYTDNTTQITSQSNDASRFPFSESALQTWLALEGQTYNHAVHNCARSEKVRRSLLHDYRVPDQCISVVGGGVNFPSMPLIETAGSKTTLNVLFVGPDFHRKGGDLVLRAFAQVRIRLPHAKLYCITSEKIADNLPLDGVELIAPTWNRLAIAALYRQADVFVLPSRHETWGDVLLEAMSFGIPCIGVTGQAMEEIVLDDETGILIPPENVIALEEALYRLLSRPDLRKQMGAAAHLRIRNEFTWDHVVDRLAVVFQKILLAN